MSAGRPLDPAAARAAVLAFVRDRRPPLAALEDPDARAVTLLEPSSGKSLRLRWDELAELAERSSPLRPAPYLQLRFHDGRQLALADVGFAFAPATRNSGPLPELPPTLCFRDFQTLVGGAESLAAHGSRGEAVRGVMAGIALIDGARDVGFEVGPEERRLEALLARLESS